MRILIDARLYGLENAGIGRYLIHLLDQLGRLDKKNKYFVLLRKKYFNSLNLAASWKRLLADFRHYTFVEQLRLPKLINRLKPDLVHFPHFNVPIFWKGNFVVTIHDMTMHRQKVGATNLPLPAYYVKRVPYKFIFKRAVNDSKKIITPTESVKRGLVDYFDIDKSKVVSIYEGFDETYSKPGVNIEVSKKYKLDQDDYLIYTGNVYPHKNIKRSIEAVVYLNKRLNRKANFAIAGSRSIFLKRIENYVREAGAEKLVRVLGFVSDSDLRTLYRKAVAFVYPSLSEGFGLQGLEAMAAGTLVLASDIPTFREVYKKNALYFNPYDFSSIAKAMEDALGMKKERRDRLIEKAKKFVNRYSWSKTAQETLKVYKEAVNGED